MIYDPPALEPIDEQVLEMISEQRDRLRAFIAGTPRRWMGSMRRSMLARAIQGSNSIEGYHATMDEALAAVENEAPVDERTETWFALKGYRDALTYIMQASHDPYFEFSKQFLKSLHFMMIGFDLSKYPGQWRPGAIYVVSSRTNEAVYEGPPSEEVDALIEELTAYLKAAATESVVVRAAMAHLNLTMIHPFKDGNGRMARALQTLVLAREGLLHPAFCSIEEWLGRNTQKYYDVLAEVGQGEWHPQKNALPWVRFCLIAHYQQCATLLRRNEEYGNIFDGVQRILKREKLPERMEMPVFDAALGFRLNNVRYRTDAGDVTEFVASRDLKRLTDLGLLEPKGETRGRSYSAAGELIELRRAAQIKTPLEDPYRLLEDGVVPRRVRSAAPRLPGL